ncbi:MAG: putative nucleocapsid protein [Trichoderma harzianum mononegavirus 1]|nr:MAG: putative nucleocapsid protein [Trichoderma harzianum mononegavirus 1]
MAAPNPLDQTLMTFKSIISDEAPAANTFNENNLLAVVEKVPYFFYAGGDANIRISALSALIRCGKSEEDDLLLWKTWTLSYFCVAFPELCDLLADPLKKDNYEARPLPESFVTSVVDAFNAYDDAIDKGKAAPDILPVINYPEELPQPPTADLEADQYSATTVDGPYAYAALLMWLCGKNCTQNKHSIQVARPDALVGEFDLKKSDYYLHGDGKMGGVAHAKVNSAWGNSRTWREKIIIHFARVREQGVTTPAYRIMSHIMNLLRWAGSSYVELIIDMLIAMPWMFDDNRFKAECAYYTQMMTVVHAQPAIARPFMKMIRGNEIASLQRKKIPALIATAVVWGSQFRASTKEYAVQEGYSQLLVDWAQDANARGYRVNVPATMNFVSAS